MANFNVLYSLKFIYLCKPLNKPLSFYVDRNMKTSCNKLLGNSSMRRIGHCLLDNVRGHWQWQIYSSCQICSVYIIIYTYIRYTVYAKVKKQHVTLACREYNMQPIQGFSYKAQL